VRSVPGRPAVTQPAPRRGSDSEAIAAFVRPTLCLMSIAGIAGLPQITVPAGEVDGCPIGLWLVGPSHSDERLLELGRAGQRAGCWGVAPK